MKGLELAFDLLRSEDIIGFCCQLLVDTEGSYYISQKLIIETKMKLSMRIEEY
jgi:hypothetical protein